MINTKYQDYQKPNELIGKTIESCQTIKAEYGRTIDSYLLITFTDGSRQLLGVHSFTFYQPSPPIEEMQKAPSFFSIDDITEKVKQDELKRREAKQRDLENKKRQLERLQEELGVK